MYGIEEIKHIAELLNTYIPEQINVSDYTVDDRGVLIERILSLFEQYIPVEKEKDINSEIVDFYYKVVQKTREQKNIIESKVKVDNYGFKIGTKASYTALLIGQNKFTKKEIIDMIDKMYGKGGKTTFNFIMYKRLREKGFNTKIEKGICKIG